MPHAVGAYLKGVGVESVELDAHNHFIVYLDNGETADAGEFKVDDALSSTSSRPLANKTIMALKGALETMISRTQESIDNRINALVGNNATTAIDNFNEIISFFEGVTDSETLVAKIAEINASIAAEQSRVNDELANRVEKITGKGLSTNDYTNEDKAEVAKIAGKQDTLTLTVKDNGNIVLGNIAGQTKEFMPATPSGDPMHYKYLKVYGLTYDESTGLWSYRASEGGLTDLTTDEVANMYIVGGTPSVQDNAWCRWAGYIVAPYPARMNIFPIFYGYRQGLTSLGNFNFAFIDNSKIKVAVVSVTPSHCCQPKECGGMFMSAKNLERIIGTIDLASSTNTGPSNLPMFKGCSSLQDVSIIRLKASIYLGDSPLLSKQSLLELIQNAEPASAITITLHAEAYARLANDADILAVLTAQPNITLISA